MKPFRILVTGSRDWRDRDVAFKALFEIWQNDPLRPLVVVHGAARGLDAIAQEWADSMRGLGYSVYDEPYPADWDRFGKAAGHRRNAQMVALGADVCLAFPLGESRGTRGCMRLAAKASIPVVDCSVVAS